MYEIEFSVDVENELQRIKKFQRNRILEEIEGQLKYEPKASTRNRKILVNFIPPWHTVPPVWELRDGEYRIFYDVDDDVKKVYVRAVRKKPHGRRTEEII